MREIDLANWPRRAHFELFRAYAQPHFGLTAPVDVTILRASGLPFSLALTYALTRAANGLPAFRWRIRGAGVVEHEAVHPSITVDLPGSDLFGFCLLTYTPDFPAFLDGARRAVAAARAGPTLHDPPGRDDLLFVSSLPWMAFTGLRHPATDPPDSVPRLTNGRVYGQGDRALMPLDVQAHHALMDGRHLGQYFAAVQALLDDPGGWLGG